MIEIKTEKGHEKEEGSEMAMKVSSQDGKVKIEKGRIEKGIQKGK